MVFTEDAAAAGEGVALQPSSLLVVTERPQDAAEEVGRVEGIGVVVAEDAAAPGQGVLVGGVRSFV